MATIELVDIAHSYVPGEWAIQDVNLMWKEGIASALLGPSGSGKTTLLKIISGLLQPTQGQVLIDGRDVTTLSPRERRVAQVFQFPVVYETLNVFDNLAFPLRNEDVPESKVKSRVESVAEMLDLTHVLKKNAQRLGAAEKQRISLGRGIVREDITAVLFDEPLTVIDPHMKWHLRRQLKEVQQQLNITMIYVTHDQHEALTFADRVTVMDNGAVLQTGTPAELHDRPRAPFVGYFIGSPGMNVFEAALHGNDIVASDFKKTLSPADTAAVAGKSLQVGIRPEFVTVYDEQQPDTFEAKVEKIHMTGNSLIADIKGAGLFFKARLPEYANTQPGDTVWVGFEDERTIVYADGIALHQPSIEGVTA